MATFPQTITLPAGLADGLTAYASQVTALYSLLIGGVIVPDNDVPWVRALVDDTLTTITVGGTATKDWTVSVAANKACYFTLGFSWSSGTTPALTYRMNGSAITAAISTTSAATGSGFIQGYIGARDSDVARNVYILQVDGTTVNHAVPNTDVTAAMTSIGITATGGSTAVKLKYLRVMRER